VSGAKKDSAAALPEMPRKELGRQSQHVGCQQNKGFVKGRAEPLPMRINSSR
jgi:hypothetical protein